MGKLDRASYPYFVPHCRELSDIERTLLTFLIGNCVPARLPELAQLKVIARCGCQKCPTILLGTDFDAVPIVGGSGSNKVIASYRGCNEDGAIVGVVLIERQGKIAELEAWSPEGADIRMWPELSELLLDDIWP